MPEQSEIDRIQEFIDVIPRPPTQSGPSLEQMYDDLQFLIDCVAELTLNLFDTFAAEALAGMLAHGETSWLRTLPDMGMIAYDCAVIMVTERERRIAEIGGFTTTVMIDL